MSVELLEALGALPYVAELEHRVLQSVMSTAIADPRLELLPAVDVTRLVQLAVRATIVEAGDLPDFGTTR